MPSTILIGNTVVLKVLQEQFFEEYLTMFSDIVCHWLHASRQYETDYLYARLNKIKPYQTYFYCIFEKFTKNLIGAIEIRSKHESLGQLYSWINENYWSKGFYREALFLVSQEYFKNEKERFFQAHVDIKNKRSYFALKKYGFIDSGIKDGPHGKQYQLIFVNNSKKDYYSFD